jgi:hypothetical protein
MSGQERPAAAAAILRVADACRSYNSQEITRDFSHVYIDMLRGIAEAGNA